MMLHPVTQTHSHKHKEWEKERSTGNGQVARSANVGIPTPALSLSMCVCVCVCVCVPVRTHLSDSMSFFLSLLPLTLFCGTRHVSSFLAHAAAPPVTARGGEVFVRVTYHRRRTTLVPLVLSLLLLLFDSHLSERFSLSQDPMPSHTASLSRSSPQPAAAATGAAAASDGTSAQPLRTTTSATALPREVLTWLQSLGLSNALKNPKRDLANGLVVAHICTHYWSQVPLHSFANGVGTASKQSNWYVLQKVLRRHGVEVSPAMVRGVVSGSDDVCAVAFVKQLYTVLTGKSLEETPVPLPEPFAVVPSAEVPVLTPSTASSAVTRARQTAESASLTSPTTALPFNGMKQRGERVAGFGPAAVASLAEGEGYFNHSSGSGGQAAAAATATTSAIALPPIVPPPPMQAVFSAEAVMSGKPALNISVRPAGQVSTVMPSSPAAATSADAAMSKASTEERRHPPCTSLAAAWFCAKVCDVQPAEVQEAILHGSGGSSTRDINAVCPTTPLSSVLSWLSAGDSALGADAVFRSDDDVARENHELLRQRAWQSLLSSVQELADVVGRYAVHGLDVLVDGLFAAVRDTAVCDGDGNEIRTGVVFVRGVLQLCTSLLALVSGVDANKALRCFQVCFLASELFAAAVYRVRWCVAGDYARLIVAALPPSRGAATAVLELLWDSIETVVRDAADAAALEEEEEEAVKHEEEQHDSAGSNDASPLVQPDVSLLTLLRALVTTLLPLNSGAVAAAAGAAATSAVVNAINSDGAGTPPVPTRRPSMRVRSANSVSAAGTAAVEGGVFDTLVARMAHRRCTATLRRLHRTQPRKAYSSSSSSFLSPLTPSHAVALAEAGAALAVDLLRVELTTPLVGDFVRGAAFFDVFYALFPPPMELQDGVGGGASLSLMDASPTLSVLRAQWLRWCLQRQLQFSLSGRHRSSCSNNSPASTWQAAPPPLSLQRRTSSLGGSTAGASDGEGVAAAAAVGAGTEGWHDSAEASAVRDGLKMLAAELFAVPKVETTTATATISGGAPSQAAKVLMAAAMAESLPYLPSQYAAEGVVAAAARHSVTSGEVSRSTKMLSMHSDGESGSGGYVEPVFGEAVAEACMHVFMRETTPAQMHALLSPVPPTLGKSAAIEAPAHPNRRYGRATSNTDGIVMVKHPFVGPLTPFGSLVLRSDVLLLVKAMLCVLASMYSSAATTSENGVTAVARRLGARAAILAREAQVEEGLATRVSWMYALLIEGRQVPSSTGAATISSASAAGAAAAADVAASLPPPPLLLMLPSSMTEAPSRRPQSAAFDNAAVSQWHGVIMECWDSFMLVLQAATLRLRQRGGSASAVAATNAATGPADEVAVREALGEGLLVCAQQAQAVVCCLERELSAALPGRGTAPGATAAVAAEVNTSTPSRADGVTFSSALLNGPIASFVAGRTAEALQAAVAWMWTVVGGS
jgi:hypothetical protein